MEQYSESTTYTFLSQSKRKWQVRYPREIYSINIIITEMFNFIKDMKVQAWYEKSRQDLFSLTFHSDIYYIVL